MFNESKYEVQRVTCDLFIHIYFVIHLLTEFWVQLGVKKYDFHFVLIKLYYKFICYK